jgi:hypothetical protein
MTTALPTASPAYGPDRPSAVTVDNATKQGSTYHRGNSVQTNGAGSVACLNGPANRGKVRGSKNNFSFLMIYLQCPYSLSLPERAVPVSPENLYSIIQMACQKKSGMKTGEKLLFWHCLATLETDKQQHFDVNPDGYFSA